LIVFALDIMNHWLVWNILFPLHEAAKGHATIRMLREMEAADRLPADELDALQRTKLREFVKYTESHVPFVRNRLADAGLKASDINGPEDLRRLPLMTKADVRNHRADLRSNLSGSLREFATGGSTGEPLIFDLAKRRIASQVANRQRVSRWWGLSIGDREFALWGSPIELTRQERLRGLRDRLLRTRLFSAFEMDENVMSRYLDALETGAWRQVFAYPSALYLLCLHARKQGRNLRRLGIKAAFVTSEVLFPYQRELISDTLNCPVANGYGGRDSGFISHECPQGGMHIMADAMIVEIVDDQGRAIPPGTVGQIVVTDLYSHEVPFLRYVTGDLGSMARRRCACGRTLPLLESIEGRSNDSIVTPDGRTMNALSMVYPLRELAGIEQFRICQQRPDRFHVQIVRNDNFTRQAEEQLRQRWNQLFRSQLEITFEYVSSLPRDKSGKLRHVVSDIAHAPNAPTVEA
jgi:phenylacetate-CoA ligase